ncbi:MAG: hypothetical protein EOP39_10225 [Rubrivivax sp.]|nr:MAG: hypothetical protein EOP39_10225 [Rubrivivax sp.]
MQFIPDFADEFFCLPPLDILVAVQADENIVRLVQELEQDCHCVALVGPHANAYAEADARAPDVLLLDASTAQGVALARRIRARFGERIVLVGQSDSRTPAAFARLFDYVLPKPLNFTRFAQALGLVPEPAGEAPPLSAVAGNARFQAEGLRRAA